MTPTLILLAGPNGAGKTTLYDTRIAPRFAGTFVNADIIQRDQLKDARPEAAYRAAKIAEGRRKSLFQQRRDFATETVFSHPSKLSLIQTARGAGYQVWVMHVGVGSADLSVARVAHRVKNDGHGVPEDKIRARYTRSEPLIRDAIRLADMGLVYDNSVAGQMPKLVLTFQNGRVINVRDHPPPWISRAYGQDIPIARTEG